MTVLGTQGKAGSGRLPRKKVDVLATGRSTMAGIPMSEGPPVVEIILVRGRLTTAGGTLVGPAVTEARTENGQGLARGHLYAIARRPSVGRARKR